MGKREKRNNGTIIKTNKKICLGQRSRQNANFPFIKLNFIWMRGEGRLQILYLEKHYGRSLLSFWGVPQRHATPRHQDECEKSQHFCIWA